MATDQPFPVKSVPTLNPSIADVSNPQSADVSQEPEANNVLDELRRKLCQPTHAPQKSKWRFW
jgi:hypothetical protein